MGVCVCARVCVFGPPKESRLLHHFTPDELPGCSSRVTMSTPCCGSMLKLGINHCAKPRGHDLAINHLWRLAPLPPTVKSQPRSPSKGAPQWPRISSLKLRPAGRPDISPPSFTHAPSSPRSPRQDRSVAHTHYRDRRSDFGSAPTCCVSLHTLLNLPIKECRSPVALKG